MSASRRKIYLPKQVFVPANLDFEKLVRGNPPPPHHNPKLTSTFKFDIDDIKYIVGTIIMIKSFHKDSIEDGYIPVNAQVIQRRVREYKYYIDYLLCCGIIEVENNGQFIKGEKSRSYKLKDKFLQDEFELVEVTKKSLVSIRDKEAAAELILNKEYGYLTKWFNNKLEIDEDGAVNILDYLYRTEKKDKKGKVMSQQTRWEKFQYRRNSIRMLQNGMYHPKVDDNVKRFHSILTNVKSELRQFITYDGKKLCAVDVKNSQPFISTVLFQPEFYQEISKTMVLNNISPTIYQSIIKSIPTILNTINSSPHIMLVESAQLEDKNSTDIQKYCYLADKGELYPYFSKKYFEQTGTKLDVTIPAEKRQLKDALFATFFSDNRFIGQPEAEMKRFFKEMFPNVYKVFSLIKKGGHNAYLPVILQQIESEVVLRRAAKRIAQIYPELPIFTIHDSIVTLDENDYPAMVKNVLKEEFEAAIGLRPNLAFDPWREK